MRERIQHTILESNKLAFAGKTKAAMDYVVDFIEETLDFFEKDPKNFLLLFHHCLRVQSNSHQRVDNQPHLRLVGLGAKLKEIGPLVEFADDIYCGRVTTAEALTHSFDAEHIFETSAFYQQILGESHQKSGVFTKAMRCFELALELDPHWYPAYQNMSACSYKLGLEKKGDHYFFLYEDANPYGLHGNFEYHADLLEELLFQKRYSDATYTIEALGDWWLDNRGFVPPEILVFSNLSLARIADSAEDSKTQKEYLSLAVQESNQAIADEKVDTNTLYFIGKMLLEHGVEEKYFEVLREILTNERRDIEQSDVIQKIGSDFVGRKELKRPIKTIKKAMEIRPDNKDLHFCLLVLKLKENKVQPEEYLLRKEQLRALSHKQSSEIEQLQLLHTLNKQFSEDPDVLRRLAVLYRSMGSATKAAHYFEQLLSLEPKSAQYRMDYIDFLMREKKLEQVQAELSKVETLRLSARITLKVQWYKVRLSLAQGGFDDAIRHISPLVLKEPWNVRYLVAEVMAKSALKGVEYEQELFRIAESGQEEVHWEDFDQNTKELLESHHYEIAYLRSKLKFIKSKGNVAELRRVTGIAENFMQKRCIGELIKLLNTNFHSGLIYWGVGKLYKSLWMLESSTEWFELALKENLDRIQKSNCFVEIADNYIWQKQDYAKAIELSRTAIELSGSKMPKALTTLAYAQLLKGDTVLARRAISHVDLRTNLDATFVAGMIEYRDGLKAKAKEIWKPIITAKSEDIRIHNLKKQIREFYYEDTQLWNRRVS